MAKKIPLHELVEAERGRVHEVLQLWGDFPECKPKHSCELDWIHTLQVQLTDVVEHARRVDTMDGEQKLMRKNLARMIATIELWDKQLADA